MGLPSKFITGRLRDPPINHSRIFMKVYESVVVSGADEIVSHVPKERCKTWLTMETWWGIDECKELRPLLTAASRSERNALQLC